MQERFRLHLNLNFCLEYSSTVKYLYEPFVVATLFLGFTSQRLCSDIFIQVMPSESEQINKIA